MRIILWVGLALGVLWGGYWFVGSAAIKSGAAQWFADIPTRGIAAEYQAISVSGFPSRFDVTFTKPRLADPVAGWGWKAPFVQVLSMSWKPWHVIAVLPQDQEIDAPGQRIALASAKLEASLRVQPSADLTLEELVIEGHDLAARSDLGWQIAAKTVVFAVARDRTQAFGQHLGLDITDLHPNPQLVGSVPELGAVISVVHLDAVLGLSAALNRHAGKTAPIVTSLIVNDFHLTWGSLNLSAKGLIEPGSDGVAMGEINFRIQGWRHIPALIIALGLASPKLEKSLTNGLEALANSGTEAAVLDLPLVFADGWMTLGPIPLGPAPTLN